MFSSGLGGRLNLLDMNRIAGGIKAAIHDNFLALVLLDVILAIKRVRYFVGHVFQHVLVTLLYDLAGEGPGHSLLGLRLVAGLRLALRWRILGPHR